MAPPADKRWNLSVLERLTSDPPDVVVMQRLAAGDDEALNALYSRYARVVNGIARRVLGDETEAQDIVQTVFVQAWQTAGRYDARRGTVAAWLSTQARSRAIDALRKRRSRREISGDLERCGAAARSAVDHVAVQQALGGLPDRQRQTIELAFFEGLTHTEIADRLGQPLGTIKTRARSGLARLRARLAVPAAPYARARRRPRGEHPRATGT